VSDPWWVLMVWMPLAVAVVLLLLLAVWSRRTRPTGFGVQDATVPPPPAHPTVEPTRWEYRILAMLISGKKTHEWLARRLWPAARTWRGEVPPVVLRTMKAVLHPMTARGWITRVEYRNPGIWEYEIADPGFDALRLGKHYAELVQG